MWKPESIIYGPGGAKVLTYLHGLVLLHQHGVLSNVKTHLGISAGSIIGTLMAVGYTPTEIVNHYSILEELLNKPINYMVILNQLTKTQSIVDINIIRTVLEKLIVEKLGVIPSFEELEQITGNRLIIVTHNLSKEVTEFLEPRTTPGMSIVDAVLMSISIIMVTGAYRHADCYYADGAISAPLPIEYIDDNQHPLLVLYIKDTYSDVSITQLVKAFIDTPINTIRNKSIKGASTNCQTIGYTIPDTNVLRLVLTPEEKQEYQTIGLTTTEPYLQLFLSGTHSIIVTSSTDD